MLNSLISAKDINSSSTLLKIVTNNNLSTKISIVSTKGIISKGEELFSINNCKEEIKILSVKYPEKQISSFKRASGDTLLGDFDGSGTVDLRDFIDFSRSYGGEYVSKHDIAPAIIGTGIWEGIYSISSPDIAVNLNDFIIFAKNYSKNIPTTLQDEIQPNPSAITNLITGKKYYVDPNTGNDTTGDGSSIQPFLTLAKAVTLVQGGDGIYLRTGNYGNFSYTKEADKYVVIQNDTGAVPQFTGLTIRATGSVTKPLNIIVSGIKVNYDGPNTTNDGAVNIRYAEHVRLYNSSISGKTKYSTEVGVYPYYCNDVIVANCNIDTSWRGISYVNCTNMVFYYNHIHGIAGSAIHTGSAGSNYISIIGNHIHDSNYDMNDPACPKTPNNPHGSGVSVRNSNVIIRNNIIHDGFNTAGITLYDDGAPILSNVLVENNLLYDIRNYYAVRIWNAGENVKFRNNTIVGHYRYLDTDPTKITTSAPARYETAVLIQTIAAGYEQVKGISFYNNILFGCFKATKAILDTNVVQSNNIFYSYQDSLFRYYNSSEIGNSSTVLTIGNSVVNDDSIALKIFSSPLRFDQNHVDAQYDVKGHGIVVPFTLCDGSQAIGFGNPQYQSSDSLGTLNSDGFILRSNVVRDASRHDAGAYQK